jgi:mannose-6-phosphate isomerase-like protein (cupin superfamily)
MTDNRQFIYHLHGLTQAHQETGRLYYEFIESSHISAGIYILPAGCSDPQEPHEEDELYYVISGKGKFMYDGADFDVESGSVLFVPRRCDHHFHHIEQELVLLVVFGPQKIP